MISRDLSLRWGLNGYSLHYNSAFRPFAPDSNCRGLYNLAKVSCDWYREEIGVRVTVLCVISGGTTVAAKCCLFLSLNLCKQEAIHYTLIEWNGISPSFPETINIPLHKRDDRELFHTVLYPVRNPIHISHSAHQYLDWRFGSSKSATWRWPVASNAWMKRLNPRSVRFLIVVINVPRCVDGLCAWNRWKHEMVTIASHCRKEAMSFTRKVLVFEMYNWYTEYISLPNPMNHAHVHT